MMPEESGTVEEAYIRVPQLVPNPKLQLRPVPAP